MATAQLARLKKVRAASTIEAIARKELVDLDGVCADCYTRMRQVAAEWLERPIEELTLDVTWGLNEWGG